MSRHGGNSSEAQQASSSVSHRPLPLASANAWISRQKTTLTPLRVRAANLQMQPTRRVSLAGARLIWHR
jgi:hypothetical protein